MDDDEFIDFGNGLSGRAKGSGWSFQEDGFTWTVGDVAVLILAARREGEAGRLMLAVRPLTYPGLEAQRVGVSIGEQRVADLVASRDCVLDVEIPAALAAVGETISVILHLPDAASPTQAGLGEDDRQLALAVKWVRWSGSGVQPAAHAGPKTVLLVRGNQVSPLTEIFNRVQSLSPYVSLVACAPALEDVGHAVMGLAEGRLAAIWLQRTPDGPSPDSLRDVAGDTPVISFPHVSMELLWPFEGHDPRLAPEPPLYPRGRYPYSDAFAYQVAAEGDQADDLAVARYRQLSEQALPDFATALGDYAALLRARDENCTIKLAGFIISQFQSVRLFHNPYAPTGALIAHLATQLAVNGGAIPAKVLGQALLELDRLTAGYLGLWYEQIPIHPAIAAGYHLRWHRPAIRYRWYENEWSFEDYIANYISWASWTV